MSHSLNLDIENLGLESTQNWCLHKNFLQLLTCYTKLSCKTHTHLRTNVQTGKSQYSWGYASKTNCVHSPIISFPDWNCFREVVTQHTCYSGICYLRPKHILRASPRKVNQTDKRMVFELGSRSPAQEAAGLLSAHCGQPAPEREATFLDKHSQQHRQASGGEHSVLLLQDMTLRGTVRLSPHRCYSYTPPHSL